MFFEEDSEEFEEKYINPRKVAKDATKKVNEATVKVLDSIRFVVKKKVKKDPSDDDYIPG